MVRRALLLGALLLGGCTTISFSNLRPTFTGAEQLEVRCSFFEPFRSELSGGLVRAYGEGWRMAALGQTTTTFLGMVVSTEPIVCYERPRAQPPKPAKRDPASDEPIDPPAR